MVKDHSDSFERKPSVDTKLAILLINSKDYLYALYHRHHSSQCSTTGVAKALACAILSVGWCI